MKPICIYHANCPDGFAAAVVVRKALKEVEFWGGVYNEPPPGLIGRNVIIVDFSYDRETMVEMAGQANSILILDHHKTAEQSLVDLPENVVTIFDMERCGAVLAWEYYNNTTLPMILQYIQDYDLHKHDFFGTREIMACLFSHQYDFDLWQSFIDDPRKIKSMREEGKHILRRQKNDISEYVSTAAYRDTIAGYSVPVVNVPYMWATDAGELLCDGEPFAACYWQNGSERVYSLRSSDRGKDVSKIAEQFGGGGHRNSAGFRVPLAAN